MNTVGYLASILIGVALGLIGGGGSILTVPVLVYLFGIDAFLAAAYSLFIVGTTSIVGSFSYFKKGLVNLKTAIFFGIPSVAAVFITRAFALPAIPRKIFSIRNFTLDKSILLLLLFALLMIFASYSMIKKDKGDYLHSEKPSANAWRVAIQGLITGTITGLVGAGGGFLIIPALVNHLRMEIKNAVGTSLLIIAFNSLLGFAVSAIQINADWIFLFKILTLTITGVLIGSYLSKNITGSKLKPAFGWFVLVMGIYIIIKETILK
ncbi:sulfite exporter TauE/SafE family protein [Flavobacterium sp. F52]|uniref:sulfite exporter TauE/SafE family protein n=1 Tax=Flavobacterium sp. F52 TaxID=1202532 RepID=UPI0002730CA7|nr:sulfite exporter TauE/SafE family protein [Flavobacterium sp. F52]EJG02046.1 hypothetical protein FF52_08559 [Flavobacterium sp. F52]